MRAIRAVGHGPGAPGARAPGPMKMNEWRRLVIGSLSREETGPRDSPSPPKRVASTSIDKWTLSGATLSGRGNIGRQHFHQPTGASLPHASPILLRVSLYLIRLVGVITFSDHRGAKDFGTVRGAGGVLGIDAF